MFRRCPVCSQVERVDTGEILKPGDPGCATPSEQFVQFSAPTHWHPEGNEAGTSRPLAQSTDEEVEALARRIVDGSRNVF